jgi:uncharacterized RDD family membrane protein YckC
MDNTPEIPATSADVLDDVEYILYQADAGKRFANYLIDRIGFYLLWKFLLVKIYVWFVITLHVPVDNRLVLYGIAYLTIISLLGLMIAGLEAATGGKTIGKYITGTRAVNDDGTRIGPKTAILRFLSRLVPFEPFSALGSPSYPWHDRWTHTIVIDERLTTLPPQE